MIAEHVSLLRSSDSDFIQELFAESEAEAAEAAAMANGRGGRRGSKSAFKLNSVGAQFRKQLQACPVPPYRLTFACGSSVMAAQRQHGRYCCTVGPCCGKTQSDKG